MQKNKVTLYVQTYCQLCDNVRNYFNDNGIEFDEIDILKPQNKEAYDLIIEKKFETVPVTSVNDFEESWEGFQHHYINKFCQ